LVAGFWFVVLRRAEDVIHLEDDGAAFGLRELRLGSLSSDRAARAWAQAARYFWSIMVSLLARARAVDEAHKGSGIAGKIGVTYRYLALLTVMRRYFLGGRNGK
jgi:hypothetical protein